MKAVTIEHTDWGAAWRQADYDFFSSPACGKLLKDNNIYFYNRYRLLNYIMLEYNLGCSSDINMDFIDGIYVVGYTTI